jgi:hypothetical protein
MLGSAEPAGTKARSRTDTDNLGATLGVSGCIGFPIAPSTTMATHPLSYTLPVDVVKSVVTLAHEQERLVFLSMPSQHETAQMDRPIFQSFAEPLHVALGHKIG